MLLGHGHGLLCRICLGCGCRCFLRGGSRGNGIVRRLVCRRIAIGRYAKILYRDGDISLRLGTPVGSYLEQDICWHLAGESVIEVLSGFRDGDPLAVLQLGVVRRIYPTPVCRKSRQAADHVLTFGIQTDIDGYGNVVVIPEIQVSEVVKESEPQ